MNFSIYVSNINEILFCIFGGQKKWSNWKGNHFFSHIWGERECLVVFLVVYHSKFQWTSENPKS